MPDPDATGSEDAPGESRTDPLAEVDDPADLSTEELRRQVEDTYDFENFGPADMARMSADEWDVAFDPDTWITGEDLLDRVEADLKSRVADRDVFARVERFDEAVVAYSDSGYAAVYPDGSVEGRGTVLRDVKPTVALCSMDSYEVPEAPEGRILPDPDEVVTSSDALGNTVLQVIGGVQVLAGLVLLVGSALYFLGVFSQPRTSGVGVNLALLVVAGVGFILVGVFMFVVVANARLSDRFRAQEYQERLRSVGLEDGERPEFLGEIDGVDALTSPPGDQPDGGDGRSTGADASATGTDEQP
ncbi:YrhK family protein [Halobacteriales archaeon Cl-PHB]